MMMYGFLMNNEMCFPLCQYESAHWDRASLEVPLVQFQQKYGTVTGILLKLHVSKLILFPLY